MTHTREQKRQQRKSACAVNSLATACLREARQQKGLFELLCACAPLDHSVTRWLLLCCFCYLIDQERKTLLPACVPDTSIHSSIHPQLAVLTGGHTYLHLPT